MVSKKELCTRGNFFLGEFSTLLVPGLIHLFFSFIFGSKIINILSLGTILNNVASMLESFLNIFGTTDKL
jgi:hypothetical protein